MSLGTNYNGTIAQGSHDWYRIVPSVTMAYRLESTGSTNTIGELYQGTTLLTSNDQGGSNNNFKIVRSLSAGVEYRLKVQASNTTTTGAYSVSVNYDVGNAPRYSDIQIGQTNNMNCAGFAMRINEYIDGVKLGVTDRSSLENVASASIRYFNMKKPSCSINRINGTNLDPGYSVANNEYRFVLKIATNNYSYLLDYHYMIQTNDGKWAHKLGGFASVNLNYINPTTYKWLWSTNNLHYNSASIYFKATR
jgi:hypothetical protein